MSYCPPLVAMSVVTRWRSTFSSSVTHSSWMSGFASVNGLVIFCMRIMSPLFTVAMVSVSAKAGAASAVMAQAPIRPRSIMLIRLSSPADQHLLM